MTAGLPWSWRAWAASAPANALVCIGAVWIWAANDVGGIVDPVKLAMAVGPNSVAIVALVSGTAGAFWLLLPFLIARMTPYPVAVFLLLAPVLPLVRWAISKADVAAGLGGSSFLENLTSAVGAVPWAGWLLLVMVVTGQLAGAVTYLIVARAVKRSP